METVARTRQQMTTVLLVNIISDCTFYRFLADVFSEILLRIVAVPFLFAIYGEISRIVAVLFYTINKNVFLGPTIEYKCYVVDQKIQRPFLKIYGTFYDNIKDLN